jgi:DNA-binding NarL/FixJ family response regulator
MNPIKTIVVADDHPLFRTALREALKQVVPGARVIEADSYPSLQNALQQHGAPDLVLLDLVMPGVRGFSSLLFLRSEYPAVPVVVVSGYEETALIRRVLQFGALGFIPKSASLETMGAAVLAVLGGKVWRHYAPRTTPDPCTGSWRRCLARPTA